LSSDFTAYRENPYPRGFPNRFPKPENEKRESETMTPSLNDSMDFRKIASRV
jgi:hypothetical protein